jgi:hypothetical protein
MKKLGDTLKSNKTAEQLDKIAEQIHEVHPVAPKKTVVVEPEPEELEKPHKLSLELPAWLIKEMKKYSKANGMTMKGIIIVELLKKFEQPK